MQRMTDQQKELAEKNMRLVYAILRRDFPKLAKPGEIEDWAQVGFEGLCKAAIGYDESRGTAFSTFAGIVITNEILQNLRYLSRPMRKEDPYTLRLDADVNDEYGISATELTPDRSQDVETSVACRDALRQLRGMAKPELIAAACGRMKQTEAGKALGISQPQVSRKIAKIRMIMKEYLYDKN